MAYKFADVTCKAQMSKLFTAASGAIDWLTYLSPAKIFIPQDKKTQHWLGYLLSPANINICPTENKRIERMEESTCSTCSHLGDLVWTYTCQKTLSIAFWFKIASLGLRSVLLTMFNSCSIDHIFWLACNTLCLSLPSHSFAIHFQPLQFSPAGTE